MPTTSHLELEDLLTVASTATLEKKDYLYYNGSSGLVHLHEGVVRVYRTCHERMVHVDFYGPGSTFGESCLDSQHHVESAVVCTDRAVFSQWPKQVVVAMIAGKPEFCAALLRMTSARSQQIFERLALAYCVKLDEHLVAALLDIANRVGIVNDADQSILIPFAVTHEVLASMIGTTREIVTAKMGELRRKGAVSFSRQSIRIWPAAMQQPMRKAVAA